MIKKSIFLEHKKVTAMEIYVGTAFLFQPLPPPGIMVVVCKWGSRGAAHAAKSLRWSVK